MGKGYFARHYVYRIFRFFTLMEIYSAVMTFVKIFYSWKLFLQRILTKEGTVSFDTALKVEIPMISFLLTV